LGKKKKKLNNNNNNKPEDNIQLSAQEEAKIQNK
jgi:hypothetical protein